MRYKHLFWDFDGTLYDSYPQILNAMKQTLRSYSLPLPSDIDLLRETKVLVSHALSIYGGGIPQEELMERFQSFHHAISSFPLYEGTAECLQTLHAAGVRHYLYTHRSLTAQKQLEQDGLWPLFTDLVTSEDGFALKPAPDALLALVERNGLNTSECAMIGDREIDVQSGYNAGMNGILFDPENFYPDCRAEKHVRSMNELCRWLLEE